MLTRHLYELDEVCSSLIEALRHRRAKEAVFWARELVLSHEEEALGKIMINAWILLLGAPAIHWLDSWTAIKDDLGGCTRLVHVADLCRLAGRTRAPLKCVVIAARGPADLADGDKVSAAVAANDPFDLYRYAGPKKPEELITMLCEFVDSPEIFDSLKIAVSGRVGIQIKTLLSVCAVQALCLSEFPGTLELESESDVASWLGEWEPSIGRRNGRQYEIQKPSVTQAEGLLGSAVELMGRGTVFWQTELALITNDETLEYITDKHFPDDIPDEWSSNERSKSHAAAGAEPVKRVREDMNQKMEDLFGFSPVLRKSWLPRLRLFMKALT